LTGLTPIGELKKVPTSSIVPMRTPRTIPQPKVESKEQDPILGAQIFLDLTSKEVRPYDYVSKHMKAISETTLNLRKNYRNELKPLPKVSGLVSTTVFENALDIYENNQVFYQDQIDDGIIEREAIARDLTALEHWFMQIIEPKPRGSELESRNAREQLKLTKGVSGYCDPELYEYIGPLPPEIRAFLLKHK